MPYIKNHCCVFKLPEFQKKQEKVRDGKVENSWDIE
jgi:hypothetical protein